MKRKLKINNINNSKKIIKFTHKNNIITINDKIKKINT